MRLPRGRYYRSFILRDYRPLWAALPRHATDNYISSSVVTALTPSSSKFHPQHFLCSPGGTLFFSSLSHSVSLSLTHNEISIKIRLYVCPHLNNEMSVKITLVFPSPPEVYHMPEPSALLSLFF